MNVNSQPPTAVISALFQTLSVTPRLEILLAIGAAEACVCHLEAALGYRQAYISQHLMVLREAGLLESRREGRFIYYKLTDQRILDLFVQAGKIAGQEVSIQPIPLFSCECPNCATGSGTVLLADITQHDGVEGGS